MKSPYMNALKRPAAAVVELFRKKDTVMGTMGKTQGVSNMAKPHNMASSIRAQREPAPEALSEGSEITLLWAVSGTAPRLRSNSQSSGLAQAPPVQASQVI